MSHTATVTETYTDAMLRLLQVARESGVQLKRTTEGEFWATSVSEPGKLYPVTATSCGCRGFHAHGRCRHLAALLSHQGKLESPIVELTPAPQTCTTCNGTGWEHITHRIRNRYVDSAVRCTDCEGRGAIAA
jgi:hypothetical protein